MTMTGAKNFIATEQGLQFDIPQNRKYVRRKISRIHVIREQDDTYTMKGYQVNNKDAKEVVSQSNIDHDMLSDVFEEMTNLPTRL